MKKFMKGFVGIVLASSVIVSVGCGPRESGEREVDDTKTQLYISNYDAGIGKAWIENLGAKFEKEFENYSFETGKTGVQVWYNHNRDDKGNTLYSTIADSADAVFCTESVDYMSLAASKLYNITDIMKKGAVTGVDDSGNLTYESNTILSKLDENWTGFLNTGTETDEKYYAIPYYFSSNSIVYDIDLWNEQGLYFAKGGCPSEVVATALDSNGNTDTAIATYNALDKNNQDNYFFVNGEGKNVSDASDTNNYGLSAGPDGNYNTDDDGLPATYDELYYLCSYMKSKNITPFIWTGKTMSYSDCITTTAWYNYSGAEQVRTYYSLQGTAKDLVKFDENGKVVKDSLGNIVTEEVELTNDGKDNGYDVQRAAGKYYALQLVEKIAQSNWTADACFSSVSNIGAQSTYLTSVNNPPRIAMLFESSWWMQEAQNTFGIMEKQNSKYSMKNRNFGMLDIPNATIEKLVEKNQNEQKSVVVTKNDNFIFLNGNLKEGSGELKAAKIFISYMHSDESMNDFTADTYMKRQLNYTLEDGVKDEMPSYSKAMLNYIEKSDVVYPVSDNDFVNVNYDTFGFSNWRFHSYNSTFGELTYPMSSLHDSTLLQKGLTSTTYFEGIYNYYKNVQWKNLNK